MGTSLSWIAIESGDADAIARALAVKRTRTNGERRGMPLAGRKLDDNRYLIVASGVEHPAFTKQQAEGGATASVDLVFDLPIDFARQPTRLHPDDALFDEPGFERLDAGWAERWRGMPLLARLAVWIAGLYLLVYLAGVVYRSLSAQAGG